MSPSVTVEFLGHQVVVQSEEERVLRRVSRSFREMLDQGHGSSRELLSVLFRGDFCELTRNGERVCANPDPAEVMRVLRHEIIDSFVRARPDLLWLHAGAAVLDGQAILFIGPYGRGKSTLVTQLCSRGWRYLSDDIVPVDLSSGHLLPFPLSPIVREGIGTELPRDRITELRKVRFPLPPHAYHRGPVPVAGLVLPSFRAGPDAVLEPFSHGAVALDLLRERINRDQNTREAIALCTTLAGQVPVLRIAFSSAAAAADLVAGEFGRHLSEQRLPA